MGASGGYNEVIPNGKPFRVEGYYERKAIPNKSHSEGNSQEGKPLRVVKSRPFMHPSLTCPSLSQPLRGFVANVA